MTDNALLKSTGVDTSQAQTMSALSPELQPASPLRSPAVTPSERNGLQPAPPSSPPSASGAESLLIRHNQLGEAYSVKLVYPGFYLTMKPQELTTAIGFPLSKEKLAKKVRPGHRFFIYVTSPERKIIGLAQASSHAAFAPERDFARPWVVDLVWVIGPKSPGVRFCDVGLLVKARVGDSAYSLTDEAAAAIAACLEDMASLTSQELSRLRERYRMFG